MAEDRVRLKKWTKEGPCANPSRFLDYVVVLTTNGRAVWNESEIQAITRWNQSRANWDIRVRIGNQKAANQTSRWFKVTRLLRKTGSRRWLLRDHYRESCGLTWTWWKGSPCVGENGGSFYHHKSWHLELTTAILAGEVDWAVPLDKVRFTRTWYREKGSKLPKVDVEYQLYNNRTPTSGSMKAERLVYSFQSDKVSLAMERYGSKLVEWSSRCKMWKAPCLSWTQCWLGIHKLNGAEVMGKLSRISLSLPSSPKPNPKTTSSTRPWWNMAMAN